jgi:hypothetical protein
MHYINVSFTQAVALSQPPVISLGVNTTSSSPSSTVSCSHLPLEAILEVQILQNTRGGFDLDFLEGGCQKWLVYVPIASICSLMLN